jgi:hypothetical protein
MSKKLKGVAVENNAEMRGAPRRGTNAYKTWVVNAVAKHPHQRTPEEQAAVEHEMDIAYRKREHPGVRRAFEVGKRAKPDEKNPFASREFQLAWEYGRTRQKK